MSACVCACVRLKISIHFSDLEMTCCYDVQSSRERACFRARNCVKTT